MIKAYCISLRDRVDRRKIVSRQFTDANIDVEFFLVDPDVGNPERGCFNSHQLVARHAKSIGENFIMIFEDDVVFDRKLSRRDFENIDWLIENQGGWDIIYLGGLLGEVWPTNRLGLVRCSLMCAHAYILSGNGINKILSAEYSGMPVDVFYAIEFKAFSLFPLVASQLSADAMRSDIAKFANREGVVTDKIWRSNRKRQYFSLLKNFAKFEILRD
jgi:glycosyl transferase family 25